MGGFSRVKRKNITRQTRPSVVNCAVPDSPDAEPPQWIWKRAGQQETFYARVPLAICKPFANSS